jgi:hypothetical protein
MTGDFAGTQEGTLHFRYLLPENGGFLRVGATLEEHAAQLADVLRDPEVTRAQTLAFVRHFLRPHGMERASTPILVEALERVAAQGARAVESEGVATKLLRVAVAPLAAIMRAAERLGALNTEKARHTLRRRTRKAAYESYAAVKRASRLAYSRIVKTPSRRAIKAVRLMLRGETSR